MTDTGKLETNAQGVLKKAQLYGGKFDDDPEIKLHSFQSPLGSIAVGIARGPGKTGPNEDSAAVIPLSNGGIALIVADGVGGLPTGWKASGLVLESLDTELSKVGDKDEDVHIRTAILNGIENANSGLLELGTGTATTLVVAEIRDKQVRTFHIGDSSAWLCGQKGAIKLQTTPHSPIGFAVEAGLMNEKEALGHEELNVISNLVGSSDMRIEIGSHVPLAVLDTLLLASDGLFDNLLEDEIVEIIRTGTVEDNIRDLWLLAAQRMAGIDDNKPSKPDDFSAVLFRPLAPNSG